MVLDSIFRTEAHSVDKELLLVIATCDHISDTSNNIVHWGDEGYNIKFLLHLLQNEDFHD